MRYTDEDITDVFARENAQPLREKPEPPSPRLTAMGTPCARSWDDDWVAFVEHREAGLERPICGARTPAGKPCMLESDHSSGRCRFHGGFELTGAPQGNRNAVIHGLYSRRLTVCGKHCPSWDSCPLGGGKVQTDRAEAAAARLRKERENGTNNAPQEAPNANEHSDGDINVMDFRKNPTPTFSRCPPTNAPRVPTNNPNTMPP